MDYLNKLKEYHEAFEYCLGASNDQIQFAEKELKIKFPRKYKQFLSECGMCNFGDTRIDGIVTIGNKTEFPIVKNTLNMRLHGLENDFIVLDFAEQEYLTLYEVSANEDGFIYGAEVQYAENDKVLIGGKTKIFNSFDDFFNDFLKLGK